ncbi:hypothetical protein FPOAC2_14264 [Fusarium poae]
MAQACRIENRWVQGAAMLDRTVNVRVIVWELGRFGHPSEALVSKVSHHLGPLRQESVEALIAQVHINGLFLKDRASKFCHSIDVARGLFFAIFDVIFLHEKIVGHPHAATGPESCAANMIFLLYQDDSEAPTIRRCRRYRRSQAAGAGAHYDDVAFGNCCSLMVGRLVMTTKVFMCCGACHHLVMRGYGLVHLFVRRQVRWKCGSFIG